MAQNLTGGILQVIDNSPSSINQALAQVLNRLDAALGLRGRAEVHDRLGANTPTVGSDVVIRDSLTDRETLFQVALLHLTPNGFPLLAPNTTYVEVAPLFRTQVNFAGPVDLEARLLVQGFGSSADLGKAVALFTVAGVQLVEVTWDGASEGLYVGAFTAVTLTTDTAVTLYAKGSNATESLVLRSVILEARLTAGSALE